MQISKLETDTDPLFELTDGTTTHGVFTIKEIREKFCHRVLSTIAMGTSYPIEMCSPCTHKCSHIVAVGKKDIF